MSKPDEHSTHAAASIAGSPRAAGVSRSEVLRGGATIAAASALGDFGGAVAGEAGRWDPSMTVSLSPEELARFRDADRLKHMYSAKPLVNRDRAYEIMDKYGLDALVATTPKNVYYLSSHDNAFYHTGIEHMLFAVLPRDEQAPPSLIIWGALLYHLDYRPTWMQSVEIYTAPLELERFAGGAPPPPELMRGDPPAMRYNRNLVRAGVEYSARDLYQLALAAEYGDRPSATALHALKRALAAAGLTSGTLGFDDARVIPWLKDVGLADVRGVEASDIFKEVRMVKSPNEIELLRETSIRCESALDVAIDSLHVGQRISDVEDQYRRRIGELGGNTRWLIINQDGLNSGRIEPNDVIKIDSVGEYKGYVGDIGRSIVVGTPSDEIVRRNEVNDKALRVAYAEIRPGMSFAEVSRIAADVMQQEGYNGFAAVHNVGIDHTDQPTSLANFSTLSRPLTFSEGSVFTIDVPYLEVGFGSSHVEDMMVCTSTGAKPLSSGDVSLRVRPA